MTLRNHLLTVLLLSGILFLFQACSKKDDNEITSREKVSIQGLVQKGPFVRGSVVTIFELNDDLSQTGRSFKSEIADDKGSFSLEGIDLISNYVEISVNGYYFDELNGKLSSSTITLNALADVSVGSSIHVNVLSHLEEKRVKLLIKDEGLHFSDAKNKALKEIYKAFYVKKDPSIKSDQLSLTSNDENANVLLGISAALLNISNSQNGRLTELLSLISTDLSRAGALSVNLSQMIKEGLEGLNAAEISNNTKRRYEELDIILADFSVDKSFSVEINGDPAVVVPEHFATELDYMQALEGVKTLMFQTSENYMKLEGLYSQTISAYPQHLFYQHKIDASDSDIRDLFSAIYRGIHGANMIIREASTSTNPQLQLFQHKSYPYFAYSYWMLMNLWGHPLYVDHNHHPEQHIRRFHKNEVSQILLDNMNVAIQHLTGYEEEKNAARIIAARIAIDMQGYAIAKQYLESIMSSGKYTLAPKNQIHLSATESILGVDYNTHPDNKPSDYDNVYGKGNYRHIFRYTEVILLAAEANLKLNNKTEAIDLLNQIRVRNDKTAILQTENNVLPLLQEEWRDELSNEGVYFGFLKRNSLSESTLHIESYQKLFPIPITEVMLNPSVQQNDGY